MRAAIYVRVSTTDQRLDVQTDELRRYVEARGWTLAACWEDRGVSGSRDRRPGLDAVMTAARRRQVDVVVVAAFDRFARSVRHLLTALDEFRALGVEFVSLREQIDTSTPLGRMVFTVVAAVAELEREVIRERVRVGIAAARRRGVRLGRPRRVFDLGRARTMLAGGTSQRAVARALGVGDATLRAALRDRAKTPLAATGEVGAESPATATPDAVRERE